MKHQCFDTTTPAGHTIRIRGDPQMNAETLDALRRMADLAYEHLSALEVVDESHDDSCAICGVAITQPRTGRPRKYCPACVAQLRHKAPILASRKTGAENATDASAQ